MNSIFLAQAHSTSQSTAKWIIIGAVILVVMACGIAILAFLLKAVFEDVAENWRVYLIIFFVIFVVATLIAAVAVSSLALAFLIGAGTAVGLMALGIFGSVASNM